MRVIGLASLLFVFAALAAGCAQAVMVTGPLPAERVVPIDATGPTTEEADLVVLALVDGSAFEDEGLPGEITLVVDGLSLSEEVGPEGEAGIIVYGPTGRLRLAPGSHEVSMKVGGTDFMTVEVELRGGKVQELVFEPVYARHRHIRKRALRLLSRERRFPPGLTGFRAYLDGREVPAREQGSGG